MSSSKLVTVEVKIAGVSSLLMAAIPHELGIEKPKVLKGEQDGPREKAEKRLYIGDDGETIVVPTAMLWKCIIEAGSFHKVGRRQLTTRDTSILPGSITLPENGYPIEPQDWEVFYAPVTNQATKGKVPSWRPRFDLPWGFTFNIVIDTTDFEIALIRQVIDDAGRRIGIGSFRPINKGPYGKFRVDCWTPQK